MEEMTVEDVRRIVEGKRVTVMATNNDYMCINIADAVMIADPDYGTKGRLILIRRGCGIRIQMEVDGLIGSICGNEDVFEIVFSDGSGGMDVTVYDDTGSTVHGRTGRGSVSRFIKEKLDRLSKLTIEEIGILLDMQSE